MGAAELVSAPSSHGQGAGAAVDGRRPEVEVALRGDERADDIVPAPALEAGRRPRVVVGRQSPERGQAIDRGGPAEDPALDHRDHARLRGHTGRRDGRHAARPRFGGSGRVEDGGVVRVVVGPGLEQHHRQVGDLAEPGRQHGASRAASHHEDAPGLSVHASPSRLRQGLDTVGCTERFFMQPALQPVKAERPDCAGRRRTKRRRVSTTARMSPHGRCVSEHPGRGGRQVVTRSHVGEEPEVHGTCELGSAPWRSAGPLKGFVQDRARVARLRGRHLRTQASTPSSGASSKPTPQAVTFSMFRSGLPMQAGSGSAIGTPPFREAPPSKSIRVSPSLSRPSWHFAFSRANVNQAPGNLEIAPGWG